MSFNKEQFIKENSSLLYKKLERFFNCEIEDYNYKSITYLISCPNVRACIYEGNIYAIHKREKESKIIIVNEIPFVAQSEAKFEIEGSDLINFIQQNAKEHNW